jgi:tripeptide aminopeptidase
MPAPFTSPLAQELAPGLLERLDRYVRVDTQSARDRTASPSTPGQLDLARLLLGELRDLGLDDAALDDNGYVTATLPGDGPVIGLIAHMDTSPDAPASGVVPIVHRDYDGGALSLPRGGTVLDPEDIPQLRDMVGHDIVTSSGDTLLGADDKAGVAEIMTAVAYLVANPQQPRPTLRICFTPDEEVGEGATLFDVEAFGAVGAYTIDGSDLGELQAETFNAAELVVTITGREIHPGYGTGKLVNAAGLVARFVAALPPELTPEVTSGREGYIFVWEVEATAGRAVARIALRDFDAARVEQYADIVRRAAEAVVAAAPPATLDIQVRDLYPNMWSHIEEHPELVQFAERAVRAEGIEPVHTAIRGGTDGSVLSARGMPTPNIFTGGHEYHSVREWASLQEMAAAAAVVVRLAGEWSSAR